MEISPVASELFHTDKQTDGHDDANNRFLQFFEQPRKMVIYIVARSSVLSHFKQSNV
jgi:hypothetical protein